MILAVIFGTSLFLEVLVNHKPIYLSYEGNAAFPALRDLGNHFLVFWRPFVDFDRSGTFGLPGNQQLDYRMFTRCIEDTEAAIGFLIDEKRGELKKVEEDF